MRDLFINTLIIIINLYKKNNNKKTIKGYGSAANNVIVRNVFVYRRMNAYKNIFVYILLHTFLK